MVDPLEEAADAHCLNVFESLEEARKQALRKAEFLGVTHCVIAYGTWTADMIVFDAGSRAGYPGWESDSAGSRRDATDEERVMWDMLPDPPDDWTPEDK